MSDVARAGAGDAERDGQRPHQCCHQTLPLTLAHNPLCLQHHQSHCIVCSIGMMCLVVAVELVACQRIGLEVRTALALGTLQYSWIQ